MAFGVVGEWGESLGHHLRAVAIADSTGARYEHARGLHGAALALRAQGEAEPARTYLGEAKQLYAELGLPEAETPDRA